MKVLDTGVKVTNKEALAAIAKAYNLVMFKRSKLKLGQLKFFYQPHYDKNNRFLYSEFVLRSSVQHAKQSQKKKKDDYDHIYDFLAKLIIFGFLVNTIYLWLVKSTASIFLFPTLIKLNRYVLEVI